MAALSGSTPEGLQKLNEFLETHHYANEGPLPSADDARILSQIKGPVCRKTYPNVYHWFHLFSFFTPQARASWGKKCDGKDKKEHKKEEKKDKHDKKEEKKEEKKVEKKAEDFDPFADDAPEEKAPQPPKPAPKPAQKKEKKKAAAKTIVVFDVKVYDTETDLKALSEKIYELNIDGLVWNREPKILDVAFGIKKLQIGMVIEDEKVLTDDLFEKIEVWEEVQSIDVVTMQKV